MENLPIYTCVTRYSDELISELVTHDTSLILCFYGSDFNYVELYEKLKKTGKHFMGCMDTGRFLNGNYHLDNYTAVGISFPTSIIESVEIISINMDSNDESIYKDCYKSVKNALHNMKIDPRNPDLEREFAIDFIYGLNSPAPILEAQNRVSLYLPVIGGESGGKLDFSKSNVMCDKGFGKIGAITVVRLNHNYRYELNMTSAFARETGKLCVTGIKNSRHILEFNNKPALDEYLDIVKIQKEQLNINTYANFTLGLETGYGEKFITSIMKESDSSLITYNDVKVGTCYGIYRATSQLHARSEKLYQLKDKRVIAYLSFDCVLCYAVRDSNSQVEEIGMLYEKELPGIPKIGFATFGEIISGTSVNQTETSIAITMIN